MKSLATLGLCSLRTTIDFPLQTWLTLSSLHKSYPFPQIICSFILPAWIVLIGTWVWDPESKWLYWSGQMNQVISPCYIVYCCITNCPNTQWLETTAILWYLAIQDFNRAWMDMSPVLYDVSRSYWLLFRWWMSWYRETRLTPLKHLVPWHGRLGV